MNVYLICERHYNQAIATNQFYQHLVGSIQENKRLRLKDNDIDLIANLDEAKRLLKSMQIESQQKLQSIVNLNNQVT